MCLGWNNLCWEGRRRTRSSRKALHKNFDSFLKFKASWCLLNAHHCLSLPAIRTLRSISILGRHFPLQIIGSFREFRRLVGGHQGEQHICLIQAINSFFCQTKNCHQKKHCCQNKENASPLVPRPLIPHEQPHQCGPNKQGEALHELDVGHHEVRVLPAKTRLILH